MGTVCNITSTDTTYDGTDEWIMVKCDITSEAGGVGYYKYRMEFMLGSSNEVID